MRKTRASGIWRTGVRMRKRRESRIIIKGREGRLNRSEEKEEWEEKDKDEEE